MITCQNLGLDGVLLFESKIFKDSRGSFSETYKHADYLNFLPKDIEFIQDNESVSQYGVLRGLHFQNPPFEQSKLVRVSEGKIQDVIVDDNNWEKGDPVIDLPGISPNNHPGTNIPVDKFYSTFYMWSEVQCCSEINPGGSQTVDFYFREPIEYYHKDRIH